MASMAGEATEVYQTALHANALLESLAEVVIGWLLLRHAAVALEALPGASDDDQHFYDGKWASARYFVRYALPKTRLRREAAEAEDGSLMDWRTPRSEPSQSQYKLDFPWRWQAGIAERVGSPHDRPDLPAHTRSEGHPQLRTRTHQR